MTLHSSPEVVATALRLYVSTLYARGLEQAKAKALPEEIHRTASTMAVLLNDADSLAPDPQRDEDLTILAGEIERYARRRKDQVDRARAALYAVEREPR